MSFSASPHSVPFNWSTIPRYTFCVNSSSAVNITDGVFTDEAAEYISKQAIYLNNPTLTRPPGACIEAESVMPLQAAKLRELNPSQAQWFYYAIDLVRPHNFKNDHWIYNHPECQLHDKNGVPVPRMVWDFGKECGVESWLNTSRELITKGGLNGIFIDGFQGCDPFNKLGCQRVCTSKAGCDPVTMTKWNEGLRAAMWRLKTEILGENGTLVCNSTPGPYLCDKNSSDPHWDPITDCPCDGTNDERGGGNWEHEQIVDAVDAANGDFLMLTHVPHANEETTMLRSIPRFLMAASKYQYLGTGFGYECSADGWLTTNNKIQHAFKAPLGEPLHVANSSKWCVNPPPCCKKNVSCSWACTRPLGAYCVRSREFASGTKAWVNYTSGATCMLWSDGVNISTPGNHKEDGCASAAAWSF
jgi:hypothetical protein